jgi:predicted amidohydrolase YtcJ
MVLAGGHVFTGDRRRPWVEAVAFDEKAVLAVGTEGEVVAAYADAERMDVGGATVVPGFIDAHNHFLATGESLDSVDVRFPTVGSTADLVEAIAEAAMSTPKGNPIRAFGFDHAKYERIPTRWDLDRATADHPVLVYHVSGHHVLVNSRMLEQQRMTDDAVDPPGGALVRDEHGRLTGLCLDAAMRLVLPVAVDVGNHGPNFHTEAPIEELVDAVERAGRAFRAAGLTTVCDAQVTARELAAYRRALLADRLLVRTIAMPLSHQLEAYETVGLAGGFGDERLRIGAMKFYADGSLIGGTAAFSEPYGAHGEFEGSMYWSEADLRAMLARAHAAGWQVGVHVQGDRAMQIVLDALEAAIRVSPREHRHRLEHAGFPTPEQIRRIAELGLVTVNQPRYLFDSGDDFLARLGDRAQRLIPLRDELDAGVVAVLSSDSDVTSYRPMDTLSSALSRRSRSGAGVGADQALSLEQALFAHTIDAAYALFMEDRIGSLEPGKLADVVILDADLSQVAPEELSLIQVRTTFLGGTRVYDVQGT